MTFYRTLRQLTGNSFRNFVMLKLLKYLHLAFLVLIITGSYGQPLHAQPLSTESFQETFQQRFNSIRSGIPNDLDYLIQRADSLLDMSVAHGDNEFITRSNYLIGLLYYFNSKHYISQKYYLEAAENPYAKANPNLAKAIWNNIGINYDLSNDIIRSLEAYQTAANYAEQAGDSTTIGRTFINRGLLYRKQRNYDKAKEITYQALDYYLPKKDIGNNIGFVMLSYQNLGIYELESGNPDKSLEFNEKALAIAIELKDRVAEHTILYNMANAYFAKEDYQAARTYLDLAKADWEPRDWLQVSERMLNLSALIELEAGNIAKAKAYMDSSRVYSERYQLHQYRELQAETELSIFAKTGDYEQFKSALAEFKRELEDKYDQQRQKTFEEMLVLYETEKIEAEKLLLGHSLAIATQRIWYLGGIIILVLMAGSIIVALYLRIRRQMRVLYEKAVLDASKESVKEDVILPITTAVDNDENNVLTATFEAIREKMREEKLFLNPRLSLSDVSAAIASNGKYVSQAINHYSGGNFNGFVNGYRVKEASKLLLEEPDMSKEEIAERAGFNSRSTFYKIFTQSTGLSPAEFTRMQKSA